MAQQPKATSMSEAPEQHIEYEEQHDGTSSVARPRRASRGERRKRANGEGTIIRRGDGKWESRISLPSGKRKSFYGHTRQEVARKLNAALRDRERDLPVVADERLTVESYLAQWLDQAIHRVRPSTYRRYRQLLAHVTQAYGRLRLTRLTAHHLATLYARLQAPQEEGGAGISTTTAHHVHTVLRQALDEAVRLDLAPINVADRVNAPKMRHTTIDPFSRKEVDRLFTAARGDRLEALYVLAVTTGMRLGELLALTWRQVDLEAGALYVVATLQRQATGSRWQLGEPKTRNSRRRIELTPRALLALRRHQARQAEELRAADLLGNDDDDVGTVEERGRNAWRDNDLVFCNTIGGLLAEGNVTRREYYPLLDRAGLPRRRFHALRHTCASLLLSDGVLLQFVSVLLGHASIEITHSTYGHLASTGMHSDILASMDRMFGESESEKAGEGGKIQA